jgi:N-acetylmuramic acid 6-phosphate (MurNAc-6-P) etherase
MIRSCLKPMKKGVGVSRCGRAADDDQWMKSAHDRGSKTQSMSNGRKPKLQDLNDRGIPTRVKKIQTLGSWKMKEGTWKKLKWH